MTATFSDQGMTGSAKAFRREVQAMRGPFSVALARPKEGFSEPMSEIGGRRWGGCEDVILHIGMLTCLRWSVGSSE